MRPQPSRGRPDRACVMTLLLASALLARPDVAQAGLRWKPSTTPRLKVVLEHPALLPVDNVKRVAIGQISGECGLELSNRITTALVTSKRYDVLDRQNFDRLMREHNFNWSGKVDTKTAAKLGKALGVDVLVFGEVARCELEQGSVQKVQEGVIIAGTPQTMNVDVARVSLTTAMQLVDLSTAKILTAMVFEGRAEREFQGKLPDKHSVMSGAYADVVERFTRLLVPWSQTVDVALYEDGDARWGLKASAFKIRLGEYAQAETMLQASLTANQSQSDAKMRSRLLHNLGLALLFSGRDAEAIDALKKAQALRATSESAEALQRAQELVSIKAQVPVPPETETALAGQPSQTTSPGASTRATPGRCPHCKASLAPGANFCPVCGKPARSSAHCTRCGRQLPQGAKFCPDDGTAAVSAQAARE